MLRDLSSTNGTELDGTPVMEAYLPPSSRIRLGDTEILFEPKKKWERIETLPDIHFGELFGASEAMRSVFAMLAKVARTDLSAILVGETGTGKELAARALHENSARADKPFIVVDCGAISPTLIESELFGHERGAFTGADRQRAGAFEEADGGTIFLDEIGEMPIDLQPKLLRALERREVKRLGATRLLEVDVRVIAATHRDLAAMIEKGDFRQDLYYRLAEVVIPLPPLRERREDIPVLVRRFLENEAEEAVIPVGDVEPSALDALKSRAWPGNVRELRNVLRRAVALASGGTIRPRDLLDLSSEGAPRSQSSWPPPAGESDPVAVGEELPIKEARERWVEPMEREYLMRLVKRCGGDLDRAAQQAGVHRKSLERLLRQHGLKASDLRDD